MSNLPQVSASRLLQAELPPSLALTYIHTIHRGKLIIAALALAGAIIGYVSTLPQPVIFRARVSMDIQPLNDNFMNRGAVTDKAAASSPESFVQTEMKLLESESLIARVVKKMLAEDGRARDRAWIEQAARHVTVRPLGMTRLVELSCDSGSQIVARDFCNTMSREFIDRDMEVRSESAENTAAWLKQQLAEVKVRLETAESRLNDFVLRNKLLLNHGKESVAEEGLRHVQGTLAVATADRIAKEAQFKIGTSSAPDSLPAVLDDNPSNQFRVKLSELRREYAEVSTSFTPESPKAQKLEAQIKALEASIEEGRTSLMGRVRNEYLAAVARERAVAQEFSQQERLLSKDVSASARLNVLEREAEAERQLYSSLSSRVKEAGFALALKSSSIRVVDAAQIPAVPFSPRRKVSAALGGLFGCLAGAAITFYRVRTNTRFRTPGEAADYFSIRELGVIPSAKGDRMQDFIAGPMWQRLLGYRRVPAGEATNLPATPLRLELITWLRKRSLMATAYRSAMSSILFGNKENPRKSFVVSSASTGEGKTTVISNLAIAAAETGRRVLLVDGDLRIPRLHAIFSVSNSFGFADVLRDDVPPEQYEIDRITFPTSVPNLYLMPRGTGLSGDVALFHSARLEAVMRRLEREFDFVLVDAPPLLHMSDARILARVTSGAVLVLRSRVATRESAKQALVQLEGDRTAVLGIVLNDFDPGRESMGDYYSSYFKYQENNGVVPT